MHSDICFHDILNPQGLFVGRMTPKAESFRAQSGPEAP